MTIHAIGEAMDICDNKPFKQSEEKFSRLEELLKVSLNVFKVTLLPGYDDNSNDKCDLFISSQINSGHKPTSVLSLFILNDTRPMVSRDSDTISTKHYMYINGMTWFKQHSYN